MEESFEEIFALVQSFSNDQEKTAEEIFVLNQSFLNHQEKSISDGLILDLQICINNLRMKNLKVERALGAISKFSSDLRSLAQLDLQIKSDGFRYAMQLIESNKNFYKSLTNCPDFIHTHNIDEIADRFLLLLTPFEARVKINAVALKKVEKFYMAGYSLLLKKMALDDVQYFVLEQKILKDVHVDSIQIVINDQICDSGLRDFCRQTNICYNFFASECMQHIIGCFNFFIIINEVFALKTLKDCTMFFITNLTKI